ncbi:MAG: DUF2461 domain-containing protein [Bacteroidetes bacterium]|nr:DUF2461 domain-containing protein [Bacteroidota bacterium]
MKKIVLEFLGELITNNNREWFQAHKAIYDEAKNEFESVINALIPGIAKFDESVKFITGKDCVFRFYRDIRFSNDKTPYKTNFGGFITKGGKKSHGPGYYLHVSPEECFLSGGIWMPAPDIMKKIRQEIYFNINEFKGIISNKAFTKYFTDIDDWDRQKTAPREFPKDFPDLDLLKNRSFTLSKGLDKKVLESDDLLDHALQVYKAMYPYNEFLRRATEA